MKFTPSAPIRGLASVAAIIGSFVCATPNVLAVAVLLMLVPVLLYSRSLFQFLRMVVFVFFPLGVGLFVIWGIIFNNHVVVEHGHQLSGAGYALLIWLRLISIAGVAQACFSGFQPAFIMRLLRSWGVRGDSLIVIAAAVAMLPEFRLRAEQIAAARCARGLMANRNLWTRLLQFPFILRTLFTLGISGGFARLDLWRSEEILIRVNSLHDRTRMTNSSPSRMGNVVFCVGSICWIYFAARTRWT